MRCAVFNCNANNDKGQGNQRFYVFPKDTVVRKKWIQFCRRKDHINPNTARICSAHFTPDDIERNMQFEMGLCLKGFKLKTGTIPTIQPQPTPTTSPRATRKHAKEKKQELINSPLEEEPVSMDELQSITIEILEPTNINELKTEDVNELKKTILRLKQEIQDLKKEKFVLIENAVAYDELTRSLRKNLQKSELERLDVERQLKTIQKRERKQKLNKTIH